MNAIQALLSRLTKSDEPSIGAVLGPIHGSRRATLLGRPEGRPEPAPGLDRRLRSLVRLASLLAVCGPRESISWAAELATASGAGDDDLAAVLLAVGPLAGAPCVVTGASRLAAALGYAQPSETLGQPQPSGTLGPPSRRRSSALPTRPAVAAPSTAPAITSLG